MLKVIMEKKIKPVKVLKGAITVPGDKSISHRAAMIGSIAEGESRIKNFLKAEDCIATMEAFKKLGVAIEISGNTVKVKGSGLRALKKPSSVIDLGNSGTSMRLLLGILAGQDFESTLTGDKSLNKRPMKRVTEPLRQMGADIRGKDDANFAPLTVRGGKLRAIDYMSPIASAQVKSSVIFAGLYATGSTSVTEPFKSRDHTERMLALFGADISVDGLKVAIKGAESLKAKDIDVPGDISSAAFFIVPAILLPGSEITIRGVGFNDTRTGFINILKRMGAKIEASNVRNDWEPVCDLTVRSSKLKATTVRKSEVPAAIDELPLLMVAALYAEGTTAIKGAGELRVKETNRIESMLHNLTKLGGNVRCEGDDVIVEGSPTRILRGSDDLKSFGDHRTAMAVTDIAILCSGNSVIDDVSCVNTSFPGFYNILESISI
jgi:3-phosphoshikimate 1-carboxyvinyltransferase